MSVDSERHEVARSKRRTARQELLLRHIPDGWIASAGRATKQLNGAGG
jgi:hypothetical protein